MKIETELKRVDDLGRIALPKEFRNKLHIDYGDELIVSLYDDRIIIETTKGEKQ